MKLFDDLKSKFTLANILFVAVCVLLIVPVIVWLVRKVPGGDKVLDKLPVAAVILTAFLGAFAFMPAKADVITKGGAQYLTAPGRYSASYTNVANFGTAMPWRFTHVNGTNHFGLNTNGVPTAVGLGTNYVGYTGTINGASAGDLYFRGGILVASNSTQRAGTTP